MDSPRIPFKSSIILLCALVSCVYLIRTTYTSTKTSFQSVFAQAPEICASIDTSDSFTQSETDRATVAEDFLVKMRGVNDLLSFGATDQDSEEFVKNYLIHLIPFIAIGVVICFLSIICLCCHCCNYACFKRCSAPTKANKIMIFGFSIIFSIAMILLAVAGLLFTEGMQHGFQRASCSVANLMVLMSGGDSSIKWVGLNPAIQSVQTIKDSLTDTLNGIPDASDALANLTTQYNQVQTDIKNYYQNNRYKTVPDPQNPLNGITPTFISQLGPETDSTTMSGLVMLEASAKYNIVATILQSLSPAISAIKGDTTLSSTLDMVIQIMTDANTALNNGLTSYNSASSTVESYNGTVATAIFVFFIVAIVLAGIILLGVLNAFTLKSKLGYKIMVFTRYLLNLILIFLALAFAVIYPITIGAMEACNATQETLKNQTLLTQYLQLLSTDTTFDDFYTCIYGDGDVMSQLGINTQMLDFSVINDGLDTFNQYANTVFPNSVIIPMQQAYINQFQTGKLPATPGIEQERYDLNDLTYEPNNAGCSQDIWFLNSANCTGTTFGTKFTSSNPAGFNYGNPTCIGFDQFAAYTASQRYLAHSAQCPDLVNAQRLVQGFKTHLSGVNNVFQGLSNDLNTVSRSDNQFMNEFRDTITSFTSIGYGVTHIIDIAGNSETGLISNLNCSFVGVNAHNIVNNVCIGYLPILFFTSIFVLAFGVAALCGLLPIFLAGKIRPDEGKKPEDSLDEDMSRKHLVDQENCCIERYETGTDVKEM